MWRRGGEICRRFKIAESPEVFFANAPLLRLLRHVQLLLPYKQQVVPLSNRVEVSLIRLGRQIIVVGCARRVTDTTPGSFVTSCSRGRIFIVSEVTVMQYVHHYPYTISQLLITGLCPRQETKIKGYINIGGYKVQADENLDPGRYGFQIVHDNDKSHYFSHDELLAIRGWMKALMKATITRDYTST